MMLLTLVEVGMMGQVLILTAKADHLLTKEQHLVKKSALKQRIINE